jgi:outer membrane beta-barrel protein
MRISKSMKALGLRELTLLACLALSVNAFAKTSKYNRHSTTPTSSDSATDSAASASKSDKSSAAPAPATGQTGDKKVDLTDLENRYWTAKDTEFNVVQNRLYTKAKRFSITPTFGAILTDQYSNGYNFGAALNYYFSERQGVELMGWGSTSQPNDTVTTFGARFGVQPDFNVPTGYIGADYNWVPIYAKLSLLEKKILYFDMSLNPGLGVTMMKSNVFSTTVTQPSPVSQGAPTLALDVAQQVFFDEHWALRLDLRNHLYNEQVYRSDTGAALRQKFTYYGAIMLGLTYFQ